MTGSPFKVFNPDTDHSRTSETTNSGWIMFVQSSGFCANVVPSSRTTLKIATVLSDKVRERPLPHPTPVLPAFPTIRFSRLACL